MKSIQAGSITWMFLALAVIAACSMEATSPQSRSTDSKGSWSAKAPLPILISENTVAAANNKIYVIGGSTADRVDQQINYEYDIATNRWRARAPLPRGMTHAGATGLNGKIYVVGAFTASGHGGAVNLVYEYNPATDSWRTLAPLKNPRGSVGVTVLNGKIHAVGGRGPDKVTVITHEVFDPASGKWTELAPLPRARDHLVVVAANGRVHAIGGRLNASSENVDQHDIFNPATNSWQAGPPLPTAAAASPEHFTKTKFSSPAANAERKKRSRSSKATM